MKQDRFGWRSNLQQDKEESHLGSGRREFSCSEVEGENSPSLTSSGKVSSGMAIKKSFGAPLLRHLVPSSAPASVSLARGYQCTHRAWGKSPCQCAATNLPGATGLPLIICHPALGTRIPASSYIFLVIDVWIMSHQLAVQVGRWKVTLILTS